MSNSNSKSGNSSTELKQSGFLADNYKESTRYYSSKQEKKVAKAVGGKVTANSGATPWSKGDVNTSKVTIECKTKTSDSNSISIKKEWLEKLKQESLFMGRDYEALCFNFGPDEPNYYIIDELTFKELLEYLEG